MDVLPESIVCHFDVTSEAKVSFAHFISVGRFFVGKNFYTIRKGLDAFLIVATISGGGILEYNGKAEKIDAGKIFWIDCKNLQNYYTDPEKDHWNLVWAHFSGPTSRDYYEVFKEFLNGAVSGEMLNDTSVTVLIDALIKQHSQPKKNNLLEVDVYNSGMLTQLMIASITAVQKNRENLHVPEVVERIRRYLDENFNQKITLNSLSSRFNLTPIYLQKLFKRHIGQSPTHYVTLLRMAEARQLLRTTRNPISEIAYAVGMDNIGYFTKVFKMHEGITPVKYRGLWNTSFS